MKLEAFCDDLNEYEWFTTLENSFSTATFERIGRRGTNPDIIERLIHYDRPDVILLADGAPVLTIEKTREVPTGHNVGQRTARLVRSIELGVPAVKFVPFRARKYGVHSGICNLNARLLMAFERMWSLHETPIIAVNWPANSHGELVEDESADTSLRLLMQGFVNSNFSKTCDAFLNARINQLKEYNSRVADYRPYSKPPSSLKIAATNRVIRDLGQTLNPSEAQHLSVRQESAVYNIGMKEKSCKRTDPFTGTQFVYDYLYCRNGPETSDKARNLILHFPEIRKQIWFDNIPNDPESKFSNWYLTATALCFRDGWTVLR